MPRIKRRLLAIPTLLAVAMGASSLAACGSRPDRSGEAWIPIQGIQTLGSFSPTLPANQKWQQLIDSFNSPTLIALRREPETRAQGYIRLRYPAPEWKSEEVGPTSIATRKDSNSYHPVTDILVADNGSLTRHSIGGYAVKGDIINAWAHDVQSRGAKDELGQEIVVIIVRNPRGASDIPRERVLELSAIGGYKKADAVASTTRAYILMDQLLRSYQAGG